LLGIFFGQKVSQVIFDSLAVLITAAALLALFRYKLGIIPVIAVCGMVGLLVSLLPLS